MRIIKRNIGADDEVLCESTQSIIIEHEGMVFVLNTIPGFANISIMPPDQRFLSGAPIRRIFLEPHSNGIGLMQSVVNPEDE